MVTWRANEDEVVDLSDYALHESASLSRILQAFRIDEEEGSETENVIYSNLESYE